MADLFAKDPARDARARGMNKLILRAAGRSQPTGGAARLVGDTSGTLAAALSNLEAAEQSGDADAIAFCTPVLDTRMEAARPAT